MTLDEAIRVGVDRTRQRQALTLKADLDSMKTAGLFTPHTTSCTVTLVLTGTEGRTRTGTGSPPSDFESDASTNFATPATRFEVYTCEGQDAAIPVGWGVIETDVVARAVMRLTQVRSTIPMRRKPPHRTPLGRVRRSPVIQWRRASIPKSSMASKPLALGSPWFRHLRAARWCRLYFLSISSNPTIS